MPRASPFLTIAEVETRQLAVPTGAAAYQKPLRCEPEGLLPQQHLRAFQLGSRLICSASDNELGSVDDRKALGIVTALEIKRLVLGGFDMCHLPRV